MLWVDMREAAAPATMAVEKFRRVIIIVVFLVLKGRRRQETVRPDAGTLSFLPLSYFSDRHLPDLARIKHAPFCIPICHPGRLVYAKAASMTGFVFFISDRVNYWMRNGCVMADLHAKSANEIVAAYSRQRITEILDDGWIG
ncbi:hypothetical protein [Rhizobium lusitanum]|uniref:hypothetical protein n=1 Tax=Rhizobium lusitanum TaxID=293958 RepID=UPI0013DB0FAA|nr:hypothetical protein [Rhizobium lusitanum]